MEAAHINDKELPPGVIERPTGETTLAIFRIQVLALLGKEKYGELSIIDLNTNPTLSNIGKDTKIPIMAKVRPWI